MVFGSGGQGFNLGNAYGEIIIRTDSINASIRQAQQAFQAGIDSMSDSMQRMGDQVTRIGAGLTAITAPLAVFGATGIKTAASFESAMAMISARTGLVGEDLQRISDFALQMGADTAFSSQQAADAFLQLLSSGQSAEQAMATLPFVLDAAAASGESLGRTADTLTDIMAAFGLGVESAESVVNSLARASASSSADMASLGQGFANVGPVAKQFGLSVDRTAAILALFAENGIKGAEAGTQLRSMLLNMTRSTDTVQNAWAELGTSFYDANGNARDLNTVMAELDAALDKLPIEEQNRLMTDLGGSYGLLGLSALRSGMSIEEMEAAMASQSDAASIAAARMDTFTGATDSLMGSIETLQIQVLTPFMEKTLKPMIVTMTEAVNRVTRWAQANPALANTLVSIGAAVVALGPALIVVGQAIGFAASGLAGLSTLVGFFGALLSGPVLAAVVAAGAALFVWRRNLFGVRDIVSRLVYNITNFADVVNDSFSMLTSGTSPVMVFATTLTRLFGLKTAIQITRRLKQFVDGFKGLFSELGTFLSGVFENFNTTVKKINLKQIAKIGTTLWSLASPLGWIKLLIEQVFQVDLFKVFLDTLIDGIGRLTEFFSRLNSGQNLAQALGIDGSNTEGALQRVGDAMSRFITFINDEVLPGVQAFGNWFISEGLPTALNYFLNTVLPGLIDGLTSIVSFVTDNVIPGLQQLADWFLVNVLPMVINFVENVAVPGFKLLFQILSDAWNLIGPALVQVANWFISDALPAIIDFINTVAIPAIRGLIDRLSSFWAAIQPGLEAFFNWVTNEGLPLVVTFFNDVISPAVQTFIDILTGLWDAVSPALSELFNWFMETGLPEIQRIIEDVITPVLNTFIDIISTIWEVVQPALSELFNWFTENGIPVIETAISGLIDVWSGLADAFTTIWDTVKTGVEGFQNGLETAFSWIRVQIIAPVKKAIDGIVDAIANAWSEVQRVGGQIRDFISGLPGVGGILGGSFASGIDYVPHDMVAQIHKGEAVLTAEQNAARLSGQGMGETLNIYGDITINSPKPVEADNFGKQLSELMRWSGKL